MIKERIALLDGKETGRVIRDNRGKLTFIYNEQWRNAVDTYPLSLSMPLTLAEHPNATMDPFLWGLLPDNEIILSNWARKFHVSARNAFSLIACVGEDCAGAVQFVQPARLNVTPGRFYYWKSSLLREINDGAAEVLAECTRKMPMTPGSFTYLQQLHGAASRVKPTEAAFPHRYDHYNCGAMAGWDDEAPTEGNIRWSRDSWTAMQPFCEHDAYVNDLGEEGEQRVREAYGQNYERLLAVKQKYDPANFFRLNQNIWPARVGGPAAVAANPLP